MKNVSGEDVNKARKNVSAEGEREKEKEKSHRMSCGSLSKRQNPHLRQVFH
jgi:hypothetical protein